MALPFDLPDLVWWKWVLLALGGVLLANVSHKMETKFTTFLALVIVILSALCGVAAIFALLNS